MDDKSDQDIDSGQTFFSRDLVKALPWAVLSKLVLFVVYFAISVIVVRLLGPEEYGLLKASDVIGVWLFVLCGLGLNTSLVRFVPELLVRRSRAALVRLIARTFLLQTAMLLSAAVLLWIARPLLDTWYYKTDTGLLVVVMAVAIGLRIWRILIEDVLTAAYYIGTLSILTLIQGVAWCGLLLLLLRLHRTAGAAYAIQGAGAAVFIVLGGIALGRFLKELPTDGTPYGVGKRRVLTLGLSSLVDSMGLMFLRQYSEVFFLSIFLTPAVAGMYGLGCETPLMVISFIPMALQKLFTAGFAEAYSKDKDCLGGLITAFYRALILALVPLACFGVFFSPRGIELIYGTEMRQAGPIAAIFCVLHLISTVWIPLSMAIVTKEKILSMFWLTCVQVGVNLAFDVLLIQRWGMYGAAAAVFLTFVLAGPIQFYAIYRIVGGIYFPVRFFVRIAVPMTLLAGAMYPLASHLSVVTWFLLGGVYLLAVPVIIRVFRLIREEEVCEIRALHIQKLNRALDILVGRPNVDDSRSA